MIPNPIQPEHSAGTEQGSCAQKLTRFDQARRLNPLRLKSVAIGVIIPHRLRKSNSKAGSSEVGALFGLHGRVIHGLQLV